METTQTVNELVEDCATQILKIDPESISIVLEIDKVISRLNSRAKGLYVSEDIRALAVKDMTNGLIASILITKNQEK